VIVRERFIIYERSAAMVQINLTKNEIQVLKHLLETCISDLRMEISNTDNIGFKQMLKDRREVLNKLYKAIIDAHEELPLAE
jgi:hypothetical protein